MEAASFNKVHREEPLSHKVERQIREAIQQNIFLPGDKLPGELELAEKFGVSRTAVREAIRILSGRGLVKTMRGSGVFVSEMDISYVVDPFYQLLELKCGEKSFYHLIRVRNFMEPEIASQAAKYRTDSDILYLRNNYEQMKQVANHPDVMGEVDIKFHQHLSKATSNPIIPIIMEPIFELLHKFIPSTYKQSHAPDLALENHRKLVEAIADQKEDVAYAVMKEHMTQAEEHVLQYYQVNEIKCD